MTPLYFSLFLLFCTTCLAVTPEKFLSQKQRTLARAANAIQNTGRVQTASENLVDGTSRVLTVDSNIEKAQQNLQNIYDVINNLKNTANTLSIPMPRSIRQPFSSLVRRSDFFLKKMSTMKKELQKRRLSKSHKQHVESIKGNSSCVHALAKSFGRLLKHYNDLVSELDYYDTTQEFKNVITKSYNNMKTFKDELEKMLYSKKPYEDCPNLQDDEGIRRIRRRLSGTHYRFAALYEMALLEEFFGLMESKFDIPVPSISSHALSQLNRINVKMTSVRLPKLHILKRIVGKIQAIFHKKITINFGFKTFRVSINDVVKKVKFLKRYLDKIFGIVLKALRINKISDYLMSKLVPSNLLGKMYSTNFSALGRIIGIPFRDFPVVTFNLKAIDFSPIFHVPFIERKKMKLALQGTKDCAIIRNNGLYFHYGGCALFERTASGQLRIGDQCVAKHGTSVVLRSCQYNEKNQQWKIVNDKIVSVASPSKCLLLRKERLNSWRRYGNVLSCNDSKHVSKFLFN